MCVTPNARRLRGPPVYSDGTLCLDIIQDQWSPIHNVCTLLTSIQVRAGLRADVGTLTEHSLPEPNANATQSLLTDPNPASPANPEAAQVYMNDRAAFNRYVACTLTCARTAQCPVTRPHFHPLV